MDADGDESQDLHTCVDHLASSLPTSDSYVEYGT